MPSVGRKFLMAGRGGLNLTHSEPFETFLKRYGTEVAPALIAALTDFKPADLIAWCESLGELTFVGSSGRVFPKSFKASPLLRAWLARLSDLGVSIRTRHDWRGWNTQGALQFTTASGDIAVPADAAILALGGASWPRLGADGSWQALLAQEGVDMTPLTPSNCGVHVSWSRIFSDRFDGSPLKNLRLSCGSVSLRGEVVVTTYGLEGGGVYALCAAMRSALTQHGTALLHIDLRDDLNMATLTARLAGGRSGHSTATSLARAGLSPIAIGLMREMTGGPLPRDPAHLAALIKGIELEVTGFAGMARAISSAGGLRFAALDENGMLKTRPGTFIAGEMLDWDAPTGGYLLQAAFATGHRAAQGTAAWLRGGDA